MPKVTLTPDDNLVLVGFSGVGKTVVGRILAGRLGREFVDTDALVAERLSLTIPGIFARFGEARFRDEERMVVVEVSRRRGLVVATGAGALMDKRNRADLSKSGVLVALRGSPEVIAARLKGTESRPLLEGEDLLTRIRELKAERKHVYDAVPIQINTDGLTPAEVADRVLEEVAVLIEE